MKKRLFVKQLLYFGDLIQKGVFQMLHQRTMDHSEKGAEQKRRSLKQKNSAENQREVSEKRAVSGARIRNQVKYTAK